MCRFNRKRPVLELHYQGWNCKDILLVQAFVHRGTTYISFRGSLLENKALEIDKIPCYTYSGASIENWICSNITGQKLLLRLFQNHGTEIASNGRVLERLFLLNCRHFANHNYLT